MIIELLNMIIELLEVKIEIVRQKWDWWKKLSVKEGADDTRKRNIWSWGYFDLQVEDILIPNQKKYL